MQPIVAIQIQHLGDEEAVLTVIDALVHLHFFRTVSAFESLYPGYELCLILQGVLVLVQVE